MNTFRPWIFYIVLIPFLSGLSISLDAQEFLVIDVTGKVMLKDNKKTVPVRYGIFLFPGSKLIIGSPGKIILVDKDGRALNFGEKGTYSFEQIKLEFDEIDNQSIRYLSYVWHKFSSHHGGDPDKLPMKPIGGVSRAEGNVMLFPYDSSVILRNEVTFSWKKSGAKQYFTLFNDSESELIKLSVADTVLTLFPYYSGLDHGKYYSWAISNAPYRKESGALFFLLPDKDWLNQFHQEERELKEFADKLSNKEQGLKMLAEFYSLKKVIR